MKEITLYQLLKMRGVNFSTDAFDSVTEEQVRRKYRMNTVRDSDGTVIGFEEIKK